MKLLLDLNGLMARDSKERCLIGLVDDAIGR